MAISLDKPKLDNLANEIWKSAERLRGKFKAYEYQNVILPMIVIRRLECVLLKWRADKAAEIRAKQPQRTAEELAALVKKLEQNPQQAPFANSTDWTLRQVYEEDPGLRDEHFRAYVNGFSQNVADILEHFNYRATITLMAKNNRLAPLLSQYKEMALGPDQLSNLEMGYIYEELLRRFSEQSGEEAGEHFTPREVIRLMVALLEIPIPERHLSIYDPACGTGGMLSVAKEHLLDRAQSAAARADVEKYVTVHGQELSPTNYAICQADLLIKNDQQATVFLGNSLIPHDEHGKEPGDQLAKPGDRFDRMLSNPPFGVTWGGKDGYEDEARKLEKTRYQAGMPRVNDGALLFLQTMLAKMKPADQGGSRIAIVFNGSPLSNGDCGSGESEIRRWILEHDWLDAIVMLPDQLFYNTGIFTYIWLLRNEKPASHRGRVLLIDARQQFEKEPKSFGNKRNRITEAHRQWIEQRYREGWAEGYADDSVKVFRTSDFAYHRVSVVFWQTDVHDQPAIVTEPYDKAFTAANMAKEQAFYDSDLEFRVRVRVPALEGEAPAEPVPLAGEAPAEPVEARGSGTAPIAARRSLECGGSTPLSERAERTVRALPLWTAAARTPKADATPLSEPVERTVRTPAPMDCGGKDAEGRRDTALAGRRDESGVDDPHVRVSAARTPKRLCRGESADPPGGTLTMDCEITFTLRPQDRFPKVFAKALKAAGLDPADDVEVLAVQWTHRHYVKDDEYIPYGDDIAAFLEREIAKPIIRWEDSPQLGYEILPNKVFYRYQPPRPATELLEEFWRLEKEAETMLEGVAR